jgi:hypothetical protein
LEATVKKRSELAGIATLFAAVTLLLLVPAMGVAGEDEEEYLTAEQYIELARPYLHLSCANAWAEVEEDQDAFLAIINKMTTIGFLNHDLDVEELVELPKETLLMVQTDFYTGIGKKCRLNPNNLLSGVVEEALLEAFTIIDREATTE